MSVRRALKAKGVRFHHLAGEPLRAYYEERVANAKATSELLLDLIRNPSWHWRPFLAAGATPRFPDNATQEVGTDLSVALPNRSH